MKNKVIAFDVKALFEDMSLTRGMTWAKIRQNLLVKNAEQLRQLVALRDAINLDVLQSALNDLFDDQKFIKVFIPESSDAGINHEIRIYNKIPDIQTYSPHATIGILIPGSNNLTSDVDISIDVVGGNNINFLNDQRHDQDEFITNLIIAKFHEHNNKLFKGITSTLNHDTNLYMFGFMKSDFSSIEKIENTWDHLYVDTKEYKENEIIYEIGSSLLPIFENISKEQWNNFKIAIENKYNLDIVSKIFKETESLYEAKNKEIQNELLTLAITSPVLKPEDEFENRTIIACNNLMFDHYEKFSQIKKSISKIEDRLNDRSLDNSTLTRLLDQRLKLQNLKHREQIFINLFQNDAFLNQSALRHVVANMQKHQEKKLFPVHIIGSALHNIGYKLKALKNSVYHDFETAYLSAKYGQRVFDLIFNQSNRFFSYQQIESLSSDGIEDLSYSLDFNSTKDPVLPKKILWNSTQKKLFTREELHLINENTKLIKSVKKNPLISDQEKLSVAKNIWDHFKTIVHKADETSTWLNVAEKIFIRYLSKYKEEENEL